MEGPDIDAVLELCDPEIVVRDPERTGRTFRSLGGVREFFEEWLENWQDLFIAFRMREGKFVEYCLYTEREDALASLGAAE